MKLTLPDITAFTDEQFAVLTLPLDGSHLVVGGPGSGKTALAVCRTDVLVKAGLPTTLLMYNQALSSYTRAAVADRGLGDVVDTWHHWFHHFWRARYNESPPMASRWGVDWTACMMRVVRSPSPPADRRYLVIDEGQDLPQSFYTLARMLDVQLTVFADDNQRITDEQSTVAEIAAAIGTTNRVALTSRFRNSEPIAALADHLRRRPDRQSTPPSPEPPPDHGAVRPLLVRLNGPADAVDYVGRVEAQHPDETIGVLLPRTSDVRRFHGQLAGKTVHPVQGYLNRSAGRPLPSLQFAEPGIKLLTWASAKGLQFDTVVLPELQAVESDPTTDNVRLRLYVVVTRARHRLAMAYSGTGEPDLVRGIPRHLVDVTGADRMP